MMKLLEILCDATIVVTLTLVGTAAVLGLLKLLSVLVGV